MSSFSLKSSSIRWLLPLYAMAGVTALAYEVLWSRMLGILFGASNTAVVITVSAFMLGLGLGSVLGAKTQRFQTFRPLLTALAVIEAIVAIYALLLPWLSAQLFTWGAWLGTWDAVATHGLAALMLLVPAMLLGFAFPLAIRAGAGCGISLHRLYGWNAAGGALGALLPVFLLPVLGWSSALQSVALMGLLLAASFFILARKHLATDLPQKANALLRPPLWHLLNYAGIGAGALMLEIVWIRMYGMILLRTEYVMAMILAVFLVGIGWGSLIAGRLPRQMALRLMPILLGMAAFLGLFLLPTTSQWVHAWQFDSLFMALLAQAALLALFTLPVTVILGAWLPLLIHHGNKENKHWDGAWLYGINSIGACFGGMLAGFVLIPLYGSVMCWLLAVLLIVLCACHWGDYRWQRMLLLLILFLPFMIWNSAFPSVSSLLSGEFAKTEDLMVYEDALSITHVVKQSNGQRILLADLQRLDASTEATAVAVQRNEARLPMLLHGAAKQVLFLGLGTGITASAALPWPMVKITAVELSAGAIKAAKHYFTLSNHNVAKHISIIQDDARRFLMRPSAHDYDVIVGDLFHPDLVGRGQLLSVQQFQRARDHLRADGLFCQWLALNQFDPSSLAIVLRSFAHVFPNNAIFVDGFRLAMVGYIGEAAKAEKIVQASQLLDDATKNKSLGGESVWTWLSRYQGSVPSILANTQGRVQDEWWPVIEYILPRIHHNNSTLPAVLAKILKTRPTLTKAITYWQIPPQKKYIFKRAWAATALTMRGQLAELSPSSASTPDAMRLFMLAHQAAPDNRWSGFAVADAMFASLSSGAPAGMRMEVALKRILTVRPDHVQALVRLCEIKKHQGDDEIFHQCEQRLHQVSPYLLIKM
ncbi:MAG: fused MFS/spermidine synthase [Mariprofundaceae bacterium]|nr:fused MFS/spermidine synthase [Mariprofundaceae bacterium]